MRYECPKPLDGKTTTLRMLLGLVRPDAGTAAIGGTPYPQLASPAPS